MRSRRSTGGRRGRAGRRSRDRSWRRRYELTGHAHIACRPYSTAGRGRTDDLLGLRQEAVLVGVGRGRSPARHAELAEDVLDMPANRVRADPERLGDLLVRLTGSEVDENVTLAFGQVVGGRRSTGERLEPVDVRLGAQGEERLLGIAELELGSGVVGECSAGEPDGD